MKISCHDMTVIPNCLQMLYRETEVNKLAKNYHNCIYILTNPLYAGYVKIGYATDLVSRLASLNTGMLRNFEMYAVYETPNKLADKQFHSLIDDLAPIVRARVFGGQKIQDKEFFKLEPEQAYDLFHHIAVMTGTENKLHKADEDTTNNQQKPTPVVEQPVIRRITVNHTEKPSMIVVDDNMFFSFVSWKDSLILHCSKIIEKIGFEEFKTRILQAKFSSNQNTKRKIFAETEAEMRGFSFYKFQQGELYLLTNYSAEAIKKINQTITEEFPEVKFEYRYKS